MQLPSLQSDNLKSMSKAKLAELAKSVFTNTEMLSASFRLGAKQAEAVDIDSVLYYYRNSDKLAGQSQTDVLDLINQVTQTLTNQQQVKKYLQHPYALRGLCIIMLCPALYEFQNHESMIRMAHALYFIGESNRIKLAKLLIRLEQPTLQSMVQSLQTFLSVEIHKLLPNSGEEAKAVEHYIFIICHLLQILFISNNLHRRIERSTFQNPEVTENFDPAVQVKLSFAKRERLNFTRYPFLFTVEYKQILLEIESKLEMKARVEQGIDDINNGILPVGEIEGGNLTIDNLIFLHFEINRSKILEDSITKLARTKASLKRPLKVTFVGEQGLDEGGVKKEYFQLLVKEVFNPHLGMFRHTNNYHWFNGDSLEPPINFELVGVLLGLSIYNSILLELHFPPILYKLLLADAEALTQIDYLRELRDIEPDIARSLTQILQNKDDLSSLQLFFQVESESFGVKHYHDLVEGGFNKPVTQENKHQYCRLYSEWLLVKHVSKQLTAFRKGFYKVVSGAMIKTLYPDELEKIICGQEQLDFEALKSTCAYQGYTQHSRIIKQLWEILFAMDLPQKKEFLAFTTGSDRAPLRGLAEIELVVQRQGPDSENLPTAQTCTNVLLIPQYSNKNKLKLKLELAIKNNQGFGLI